MLSHPAADTVIPLYQDHAATFVARRGRALIEHAWLSRFLALLPATAAKVLDIGCGNGVPMARHLIQAGCRITGVDTSPPLLASARTTFPDHTWLAQDMRRLDLSDQFHGLLAWHSFFHLKPADQRPMFATFQRLAAPGAALMFTSGTHLGEAIGDLAGQPLYHGSLDCLEYQDLLAQHGFTVLRHVECDPDCGGATVWLARQSGMPG